MEGRFTFCTTRGRSVNDYLLLSPINYDKISAFEVKQFNEFSDHSPIFFELDFSNNRQPFEPPAVHSFIKWNNDKNHEYIQKLLSNQNTLFSLVDDIASVDDMNSVVRNISDILYKYAFEVYGRSVLIRDNVNPERPNNEWFDEKCATARRNFHSARNFFNDIPAMQTVIHTFLPETCLIKPSARHKLFLNVERVSNFVKLRKRSPGNSGQL